MQNNYSFDKFDLVKVTGDTTFSLSLGLREYTLVQLIKLRLRDASEYRSAYHRGADHQAMYCAYRSVNLELPVCAGLEFKIHNIDNPTATTIHLRNPELMVAHVLGLDLSNEAAAKTVKSIAGKISARFDVDLTKLDKRCVQVVPDPKAKMAKKQTGALIGEHPNESEIVLGSVFLCANNLTYRAGTPYVGAQTNCVYPVRGLCMAVVGESIDTPDPRMPEYSVRNVKFLVTAGISGDESFQTTTWTASYSTASTQQVKHLIKIAATPEAEQQGAQ